MDRFIKAITIFTICLIIASVVLVVAGVRLRLDGSKTATVECEVVDKYSEHYNRGNRAYYVVISYEGMEAKVNVSSESFFESIRIGSTVSCELTYDEKGIIKAKTVE